MKSKAAAKQSKAVNVLAKQVAQVNIPVAVTAPAPMPKVVPANVAGWITVEVVLYAIIVIAAGALRLINLAAAPLSAHEAEQALAAFNGAVLPSGGSPVLYSLNQVLFGLFGTSIGDAGARLGTALIGTIMVLMPALYRKHIGRIGALAAMLMLAISPTMTFAARTLDGQIVTAACGLAAVGLGLRYFESHQRRDLIGLAIVVGLGLTSGSGLVTLIIVISIGSLIVYRWSASEADRATVRQVREQSDQLRTAAMCGGAAFLLASTVMLLRPSAIGGVPESISAWLAAWRGSDTVGVLQLFQIMLIDEPLIVWFGLAGIVYAIIRGHGLSIVLSVWSIGALLITLLQPGRQPIDLVLALTPLALLGGQVVQTASTALIEHGAWQIEGAVWLIVAPLTGYLAVSLGAYASGRNLIGNAQILGQTLNPMTSFVVLLVMLTLIVGAVFALAIGIRATLRAGAVAAWVIFAVISLSNAWSATQLHASDPRELLWNPTTVTTDVRAVVQAVEAASVRTTGNLHQAAVTIALSPVDPVIAWYLRDFKDVRWAAVPDAQTPIAITPFGVQLPAEQGGYIGAKFVTRVTWSPAQLTDADLLRWWLYRETDQPIPLQTLIVWVKTAP